jgi:hypothetical protein
MEVVLVACAAALAAIATLLLVPAALSKTQGLWERRRDPRSEDSQSPIEHPAPAAQSTRRKPGRPPISVPDSSVRAMRMPPERVHWTRAFGANAVNRAESVTRARVGLDGFDEMDVRGHGRDPGEVLEDADAGGNEPGIAVDARNVFWRTDGSTDCSACASSRLRAAAFCLRCGRKLE